MLIGGIFSGEKPNEAVEQAGEAINQIAINAQEGLLQASLAAWTPKPTRAAPGVRRRCIAGRRR